jgi:putative colanic acid biosynthesis glycosyltransferase
MKILQINTTYNSGSTGRIASQIGEKISYLNGISYIGYGRGKSISTYSELFKIGSKIDFYFHALVTRFFDLHGFASRVKTKKLIKYIDKIDIDIIHLHNVHGYYLNLTILFEYLNKRNLPVVWTLHDCWSFTGHCAHYMSLNCRKWENYCNRCPQINTYPSSLFWDNSKNNFFAKKKLFTALPNLTLVPVSKWLETELKKSFFINSSIQQIYNGIDLNCFNPNRKIKNFIISEKLINKKIILGVANVWTEKKGYHDFLALSKILSSDYQIVLIGVNKKQLNSLNKNIIGIIKTECLDELVWWYSNSLVLFNPTYEDTYPTVNLESIACGTPVITYSTGGSPESLSDSTGYVIEKGKLDLVLNSIKFLDSQDRLQISQNCRNYAIANFNNSDSIEKYIQLYKQLLKKA